MTAQENTAATAPSTKKAPVDKGVLDIADKSVLTTFEPSHGPNMDDRSDVVTPTPGDEGKELGRNE